MFRRLTFSLGATLVALVAISGVGPSVAGAQPAASAQVRMAHFSPDAPPTDVYITGFDGTQQLVLPGLGYGQVSQYLPLQTGDYTFSMRPAGAATTTPAVVTSWAHLDADASYTFEAVGQLATITSSVIDDKFMTPPQGQASVRVIQAATTSPNVDVHVVQGPVLADRAAFPSATDYSSVPAGSVQVQLSTAGGTGQPALEALTLDAGTVNSLVVLDGTAGHPLRLVKVVDATGTLGQSTGAPALPVGGIQTGGGGTAPSSGAGLGLPIVLVGLGAFTVVFALAARRHGGTV